MKLLDLKHFQQFSSSQKVKVLRHKSSDENLWDLRRNGRFDEYQNHQAWDVFGDAEYIISFIAERHKFAKFVGVWKVLDKRDKYPDKGYEYTTIEIKGFEDLAGRLIVSWGDGSRAWAQWLHSAGNKEIYELLPPNYVMDFPGFYDFVLSYADLQQMINHPESNREWHRMLSSISGVYVILDKSTGNQYVGSACGEGGLWQRWASYAKDPSGGNVLMKDLLSHTPNAFENFQFSVLRVLEPGSTPKDVLTQERLAKNKLGSRAFGLNDN